MRRDRGAHGERVRAQPARLQPVERVHCVEQRVESARVRRPVGHEHLRVQESRELGRVLVGAPVEQQLGTRDGRRGAERQARPAGRREPPLRVAARARRTARHQLLDSDEREAGEHTDAHEEHFTRRVVTVEKLRRDAPQARRRSRSDRSDRRGERRGERRAAAAHLLGSCECDARSRDL